MSSRAERLMAMGQMAATLAHEIRNPLGSMELYCTLLKKDLASQPDQHKLAENIHDGIKRVNQIIRDCLQFTRDIKPRWQVVTDFNLLLTKALNQLQTNFSNCEVNISAHGEQNVELDCALFEQAVVNILSNAIHASSMAYALIERKALVNISFGGNHSDTWLLVIQDSGQGIPAEIKDQIFDPFFTTKEGGTGLGLSIVHQIICAHNGIVDIESSSAGTCFKIQIPRRHNGVYKSDNTGQTTHSFS